METIDFDNQSRIWKKQIEELCEQHAGDAKTAEGGLRAIGSQIENIFGRKGMDDVIAMLNNDQQTIVKGLWDGIG